jgi:hypothetical protein
MSDTIVLLHGLATGSPSWGQIAEPLVPSGASAFAPNMLGTASSLPSISS